MPNQLTTLSDQILVYLLQHRSTNPDFTFSLRRRDSSLAKDVKRLDNGQWFQGSDYIAVPLFRKADTLQSIKTISFVVSLSGSSINKGIQISTKGSDFEESEIELHQLLREELILRGFYANKDDIHTFPESQDIFGNLHYYITGFRDKAIELLKERNLLERYLIPQEHFEKRLEMITAIRNKLYSTTHAMHNKITDLLKYKKQIILQGPPGTGKTKLAKELAYELIGSSSEEQLKLIQFHPSYTYEDFVRGIVAKPDADNERVVYEAENKMLALLAKDAWNNYNQATVNSEANNIYTIKENLSRFINHIIQSLDASGVGKYPITEKVYIYSADDRRFKYKGDEWDAHPNGANMNFSELEKIIEANISERQAIVKNESLNGLTRQHASYFAKVVEKYNEFNRKSPPETVVKVPLKNYVLIIDEINRANLSAVLGELIYALEYRNKEVESMYEVDGSSQLILPHNLYIIGTMNTADRSASHIDYAIRRRFAFVDVLPHSLENEKDIVFDVSLFKEVAKLFVDDYDANIDYSNTVTQLKRSKYLSEEFNPEEVWLGHSYFIDKSKDGGSMAIRLAYEIKPILLEYVKDGVLKQEAKEMILALQTSIN